MAFEYSLVMDVNTFIIVLSLAVNHIQVCASQQCDSACVGGCDAFTRACNNCTSNRYDQFCDGACSEFCKYSCDRYTGNCDSCNTGKYASWCIESCSEGCSSGCDMETGNCALCKTGWYGVWCNVHCPGGCNGECNRISGNCLSCKQGFYGRHCNVACLETGCARGCDQFYGTCQVCQAGFYGQSCETECSINCKQSMCDSFTGYCIDCNQGYFGSTCNQPCPEKCNGICNFLNGSCFTCKTGYYGERCASQCPDNCNGQCSKTGTCFSCVNGYFGDKCQYTCSEHCHTSCDQHTGLCYVCENGYWGELCNKSCGNNCFGHCHKNTSLCFACIPGWYGRFCEEQCPNTCKNESCTPTGMCVSCVNVFFGEHCEMMCDYCKNDTCRQQDGVCLFGCVNGSDCKDGFTTTPKETIIASDGTTMVDPISSTFFPTEFNATSQTFITKTTTEDSTETEDDETQPPTSIIIVIVTLAVLAFCACSITIIVICVIRIFRPKIEERPGDENVYTKVYDEIGNIELTYACLEPTVRQGNNQDMETSSYNDIEIFLENPTPGTPYQYIEPETEPAIESNIETAVKTIIGQSKDQNRDGNTKNNNQLENIAQIAAFTEETTCPATNGYPSYTVENNDHHTASTERPVAVNNSYVRPSSNSSSCGYSEVLPTTSLPQQAMTIHELSPLGSRTPISIQRTESGADVQSAHYCVVTEPTMPTKQENEETRRESQSSAFTEATTSPTTNVNPPYNNHQTAKIKSPVNFPVTDNNYFVRPSSSSSSCGYSQVFSTTSLSQQAMTIHEISPLGSRTAISIQRTESGADVQSEHYCVVEKPTTPTKQENEEARRESQCSAFTEATSPTTNVNPPYNNQQTAKIKSPVNFPVTDTNFFVRPSSSSSSCGYSHIFPTTSLPQQAMTIHEISPLDSSKAISIQIPGSDADVQSAHYCVVGEPTMPTKQVNEETRRESQSSAFTEATSLTTNVNPPYNNHQTAKIESPVNCPVTDNNYFVRPSSSSSSCGYFQVFPTTSLPQQAMTIHEISALGSSQAISIQIQGSDADVQSEHYCVVEEPTTPRKQENAESGRESQSSAYAGVS